MSMQETVSTGIPGLDAILGGGYPRRRITLIEGAPGAGKTTAALQFLHAAAARGETGMFLSIAQTRDEVGVIAEAHGIDLDGIDLVSPSVDAAAARAGVSVDSHESALRALLAEVEEALQRARPDVFVFDSLLELRLLSSSEFGYRRNLLELRRQMRTAGVTALLLNHIGAPEDGESQVRGIMHGVVRLEWGFPPIGAMHRRLSVTKMRGAAFREGYHDVRIRTGGLSVFPRVVPSRFEPLDAALPQLEVSEEPLNRMLGGGLEFGTTTLIAGQAGSGKSTLGALFAAEAARQGLDAALFLFEERPDIFRLRSESLGMPLRTREAEGRLSLSHYHPAEVSPGEFTSDVISAAEAGARVIVIDSLTGFLSALPNRENVLTHLHTLLDHLSGRGCLVIVTLAQKGLLDEPPEPDLETSYIADSVILLRQYASHRQIRRSIAVVKKRHSVHERGIRELVIRPGAVEVREMSEEAADAAIGATPISGS